ncbi:MAG: 16S rRNA (cytosine(1402)-N(4))-methyltransferase RsmH [Xanthomonadales bacterium]|nr:16S rRNA (cytosine(1402)-N(4))-methyltransferase RsmH [Xanthomonadales bacterium]
MLDEVLEGLDLKPEGRYLDGTFGRGGHAREVLARLGPRGRLLLMDRDPEAVASAVREFGADPRVAIRHANFATMTQWEEARELDGVLLDLGVSSPQLDDASRGFSFQGEGPLDMRMDPTRGPSVAEWLACAEETEIADVLWRYGEERMSRRIARAIVERRRLHPLATTAGLADLVARTIGYRERSKHPATRTFQALRIHINDELGALPAGLAAALAGLKPGGRLAVISFHSLEDRIVKQFIRGEPAPAVRRGLPAPAAAPAPLRAIGKARFATAAETAANPRARSAVLRIAEKTA